MTYNFIKTKSDNHVFTLTLARSEKRNAFTPTMINEVNHALAVANSEKEVWLVVINAEGPVFCAGMDLKIFENPELDHRNPEIDNQDISLATAISQLNKPSIAILEGDVMAGGFLIILECTYVFAKESVHFSLPEVKRGIFPFQVLGSLLKIMPQNKAMDLCISAKTFDTEEAKKLGIVYDFYSTENFNKLKANILSNAPRAISKGFEALKKLQELQENEKLSYLLETLSELKSSKDAQEGIASFFEKRAPNWLNE
ncbi:enoyl-CoA hydratase/isomerase family protein [Lacihabitans soyangensis]|uniref:Enoyl-CoA hydratase/isomerase family protein n=1 Tax=Lacihabitans soyangensis TaxID=869394 RepID=A0AAE3H2U2_9BACT|nr:enoyl-CoA hydratase-related protein [Lacihabitans soyangensis]MCP9762959.1 enoyl-CoA hydratase/isomerase family protein [Lacihabitans soyangensis]